MPFARIFVTDKNNQAVDRLVRVYRRDTGALLGEGRSVSSNTGGNGGNTTAFGLTAIGGGNNAVGGSGGGGGGKSSFGGGGNKAASMTLSLFSFSAKANCSLIIFLITGAAITVAKKTAPTNNALVVVFGSCARNS